LLLFYHPVENEIIFVPHTIEQVFKELSEITDIWLFFKFERSAVV